MKGGFLVALTYGWETVWVRDLVAAGGCQLETRGALYQLSVPTNVSRAQLWCILISDRLALCALLAYSHAKSP
jgi:hypothetical protein